MSKRLFVSNRDESVRLFKNPVLEYFSHIHPAMPIIVYIPVVAIILFFAYTYTTITNIIAFFAGGIVLWSLFEYVFHRFVFHYNPKTDFGKRIHFLSHGVHHDYPRDRTRLVMPLLVSVPLAIIFYFIFYYVFGPVFYLPIFAGFIFGYVCYDSIHYATHHIKLPGKAGSYIKEYHLKHHYVNPDSAYGVSSPLWDFVFMTVPIKAGTGNENQ
ncbi:MAG: sterol desaturase family protein [Ignavibacteria bacterium]|nr:sterol desaturase family protein [Ignavibacteria bacterium]